MTIQMKRTVSRIILMLLITVHIVTWYSLGIHVVGSIGIEAFFSGLSRGVLNAGFIFWVLAFISAVLLGRAFCGWFCWFGGYLELVEWGIGDKLKIKIPKRILLYLGAIPIVALGLKIYAAFLNNWIVQGIPAAWTFRLADVEPWGGQQTGISILITAILFGPVLLYVFGRRAWCRYLCPIGALLKVFSKVSVGKIRLVNDECMACGICNRACEMQVDVMGDLKAYGAVNSSDCIVCLKCTDACPTQSIVHGLERDRASLTPDASVRVELSSSKRRRLSGFDVAIALLWIGTSVSISLAGFNQNAPQEIKVLMTPGLLILFYGLVWAGWKVLRRYAPQRKSA